MNVNKREEEQKERFSWGWKTGALILILAILVVSAKFASEIKQNARMETRLENYMPEKHPAFVYSDKAEEWFNIKDSVIFAIHNEAGIY
ncbi:MAG TPA: hypothetical protein ENN73_06315, partial [Firmicutes bacterium]|nr:hypothetical protein [Bacillota bacterium]